MSNESQMSQKELNKILDDHQLWLANSKEGKRGNLSYAGLRYADRYAFPHASLNDSGWLIFAGCRRFTLDEARSHWGESYSGERWIGDMYLHAVDWLEQRIAEEGE